MEKIELEARFRKSVEDKERERERLALQMQSQINDLTMNLDKVKMEH